MTDHEYLEKMIALAKELERAGSACPYDPDDYNNIIDTLNLIHAKWYRRHYRHHWIRIFVLIAVILLALRFIIWTLFLKYIF